MLLLVVPLQEAVGTSAECSEGETSLQLSVWSEAPSPIFFVMWMKHEFGDITT